VASILYNDHLIVSYPYSTRQPRLGSLRFSSLALDETQSFQSRAEAEYAGLDVAKGVIDSFELGLGLTSMSNRATS
jgi:hypothetical protein